MSGAVSKGTLAISYCAGKAVLTLYFAAMVMSDWIAALKVKRARRAAQASCDRVVDVRTDVSLPLCGSGDRDDLVSVGPKEAGAFRWRSDSVANCPTGARSPTVAKSMGSKQGIFVSFHRASAGRRCAGRRLPSVVAYTRPGPGRFSAGDFQMHMDDPPN